MVQDINHKNLNEYKQDLTEVNLVRYHEKTFQQINELMKKLASLQTIKGLVPTYGHFI